jgi:tRNA(His) 5'-end guanylyltransferase
MKSCQSPVEIVLADSEWHKEERVIDEIGARMKAYEKEALTREKLDRNLPLVARMDGHCFHQWVKAFKNKDCYDRRITVAMVETAKDLVQKFQAVLAYLQSDEITLVFNLNRLPEHNYLFDGRTLKLATVLAGYTSARFNYHIMNQVYSESEKKQLKLVNSFLAHFDARVFNVPTTGEVLNNIIWRCNFDCQRNSIDKLARFHFNSKQLHGVGTGGKLTMLKEKGIDWHAYPEDFKWGSFIKRKLVKKMGGPNNDVECLRGVTEVRYLGPIKYNQENIDVIFAKYWDE